MRGIGWQRSNATIARPLLNFDSCWENWHTQHVERCFDMSNVAVRHVAVFGNMSTIFLSFRYVETYWTCSISFDMSNERATSCCWRSWCERLCWHVELSSIFITCLFVSVGTYLLQSWCNLCHIPLKILKWSFSSASYPPKRGRLPIHGHTQRKSPGVTEQYQLLSEKKLPMFCCHLQLPVRIKWHFLHFSLKSKYRTEQDWTYACHIVITSSSSSSTNFIAIQVLQNFRADVMHYYHSIWNYSAVWKK